MQTREKNKTKQAGTFLVKRQVKPKTKKLTAKQKAVKNREKIFSDAKYVYLTVNYIAVVGRGGTKYYKKNDENRAIARKAKGSKLRMGKNGNRYTNI